MRILTALTYYRPHYSGLTIYTERIARELVARGHQVTILTSRFNDQLSPHEFCDGVEVIRPKVWFRISKGVIMPSIVKWAWKLAQNADIVHLHVPQLDAAPIALLGRSLNRPVVLTYHCDLHLPGGLVHSLANTASNLANIITAKFSNIIIHNSSDYAENSTFLSHYLDKLIAIAPPVDLFPVNETDVLAFRKKCNIGPGEHVIGMAARLASEKGVEYLAQAFPLVLNKNPHARVLFVGPYSEVVGEETYARRVNSLVEPLGKHWSFLGAVSPVEMAAFFKVSDVVVLPSLNSTESYGIVQVEAMTSGTPVVASDLPGVRVPVRMTGMGIIVPAANSTALADAINKILESPAHYKGHPERLLSLTKPEAVAAKYEEIFKALLNKNSQSLFKPLGETIE